MINTNKVVTSNIFK